MENGSGAKASVYIRSSHHPGSNTPADAVFGGLCIGADSGSSGDGFSRREDVGFPYYENYCSR